MLKGVRGDRVLIGDPALGLKSYSRAEFEVVWNNVIFAIHDDDHLKGAFNQDVGMAPMGLTRRSAPQWTPRSLASSVNCRRSTK